MTELPEGFRPFVDALKAHIRESQLRAALAVNRTLLTLYWNIGRAITDRQDVEGWGARVIDQLADEIQRAFPGVGGFSRPNIYRMRAFYLAYPLENRPSEIVSQPVRQFAEPLPAGVPDLPWNHIVTLQRLKDPSLRAWYARAAVEGGWSRAVLLTQIETRLHEREGAAITNFARTLPPPRSDLAQQTLKDPYVFDFLTLGREAHERDLEAGLVAHVERFLLELGVGFAFVGRQVHLAVGGAGLLPRPALLSPQAPVLRGDRAQGRGLRARVRGQDELLPLRRRRPDASPERRAEHRVDPVQRA